MCGHFHHSEHPGAGRIALTIAGGIAFAAIMAAVLGVIVKLLWNWLMPDIFGLTTITFWQAWGLVVLAHIFFKSFPKHDYHPHSIHWKKKFHDKYKDPHSGHEETVSEA